MDGIRIHEVKPFKTPLIHPTKLSVTQAPESGEKGHYYIC